MIAYAGLETGVRHEACYVLRQGHITFVLTSPLSGKHPDAQRLVTHGDGVQSIALEVADVTAAFNAALPAGRRRPSRHRRLKTSSGFTKSPRSKLTETRRTRLSTDRGTRGFSRRASSQWMPIGTVRDSFHQVGLKSIDHIVANVEEGKMGDWVDYYSKIMGFSVLASFDDKDISTDYSALMSKVVADGRGRIKFPINEPAKSRRRSQIDEFLEFYGGPGVQHIALATGDIIKSVRAMIKNDVSFLKVPPAYYELLPDRVGEVKENLQELAELGILVDRDDEGYLLQIFTKPVEDRPTLFFEIIQRRGRAVSARGISRRCSSPSSANRRGEERSSGWSNLSSGLCS